MLVGDPIIGMNSNGTGAVVGAGSLRPIFTAPSCKATIISLEQCAYILIFSISFPDLIKISLLYGYPLKKGSGERRLKDRVTLQIILVFTLTPPQNIYWGLCKCICQILH